VSSAFCVRPRRLRTLSLVASLLAPGLLQAQTAGLAGGLPPDLVGLALRHQPRYLGGAERSTELQPLLLLQRGPWFVGSRAGVPAAGYELAPGPGWRLGAFVGLQGGRERDDGPRLQGLDAIDTHAVLGLHASWRHQRLGLSAAWRQAARSGLGGALQLDGSLEAWSQGPHALGLGLGATWANAAAMRTQFGIRPYEAQRSPLGLPAYGPGAGLSSLQATVRWRWQLAPRWTLLSTVGAQTLRGDAADSPLVERPTQTSLTLGLLHAF
jgi:outer membrane scaffolding protein for murein synthesis (MipA/OmpV family)